MDSSQIAILQPYLDALPFYAMLIDRDHRIVACNRAVSAALGAEPSAILGQYCPRLIHGLEEPYPGCPLEKSVERGGPQEVEFYDETQDCWLHSMVFPVEAKGEPPVYVHFTRDITEVVRTRESLEQCGRQLKHQVRLETQSHLTARSIHDLNNLFTLILGYADLVLQESVGSAEIADDVKVIQRSVLRAVALTDRLNLIGRTSEQPGPARAFDLVTLTRDLEDLLRSSMGGQVELIVQAPEQAVPIMGVEADVEHALINLVTNARHAMPDGGRVVVTLSEVTLEPGQDFFGTDTPMGRYARISVADTGCGMDADTLVAAFEPFVSQSPNRAGSGLGLSSVRACVESIGGHLQVASTPGAGTTFELFLPWLTTASPAGEARADPIVAGTGQTVLVVEPDASLRRMIVRLLRLGGYRTLEAENATACMAAVTRHHGVIDVVIVDMALTDWAQLIRRLLQAVPGARVVRLTDRASPARERDPVADGDQVLFKPFTRSHLQRAVSSALAR